MHLPIEWLFFSFFLGNEVIGVMWFLVGCPPKNAWE